MQQRAVCVSCQQKIAELEERVAQLTAQNEQLARESITDPLTGALNHRGFVGAAQREMSRAERTHEMLRAELMCERLCFVFADLNRFKNVNDQHGHPVGDRVLQKFVRILKNNCRKIDSVARIGGDEFCIILPETDFAKARMYVERLNRKVQQGLVVHTDTGVEVRITASFGLAEYKIGSDLNELKNEADAALYRAKAESRQRAFTPDEKEFVLEFLEIPVV